MFVANKVKDLQCTRHVLGTEILSGVLILDIVLTRKTTCFPKQATSGSPNNNRPSEAKAKMARCSYSATKPFRESGVDCETYWLWQQRQQLPRVTPPLWPSTPQLIFYWFTVKNDPTGCFVKSPTSYFKRNQIILRKQRCHCMKSLKFRKYPVMKCRFWPLYYNMQSDSAALHVPPNNVLAQMAAKFP